MTLLSFYYLCFLLADILNLVQSYPYLSIVEYVTQYRTIMSWIGDKAEDAVENKIFEEGGYPAWIKYKAWKAYESCSECCK